MPTDCEPWPGKTKANGAMRISKIKDENRLQALYSLGLPL
jgi:hypothetical protein